jgi:hypothetical protein
MSDQTRQLEQNLALCLQKDRYSLHRKISRLASDIRAGKDGMQDLQALEELISRSIARKQARVESVPPFTYPDDLPVAE